jgi:hypothetical protein
MGQIRYLFKTGWIPMTPEVEALLEEFKDLKDSQIVKMESLFQNQGGS